MKTNLTPAGTALLAVIAWSTPIPAGSATAGPAYALSFNGTNQYVSAAIPPLASNFTVSAWIFLRAGGNWAGFRQGVLSATNCGGSAEVLIHSLTSSYTDPQYLELGRCGSFNGTVSTTAVPTNQWVHVALTVSTNKQVSYFINGIAAGSWDAGSTTLDLTLGPNITLAENGVRRFNGELDEVQIWNVARSPADIQAGMNRTPAGNESDLVAYWRFDEGAGTIAANSAPTGSFSDGTLANSPIWVLSPIPFVPDVRTGGATDVSLTGATLNGTVNPRNLAATAWFEWGTDTNYGSLTSAASLPATNDSLAVSAMPSNLMPGLIYHFRLAATNSLGLTFGGDQSFAMPSAPSVMTLAASRIGLDRSTLNGNVNPNGLTTTAWFDWGTTTNYGGTTAVTGLGSGLNPVPLSNELTGLLRNASYHYRVVAINSVGTNYGADLAFRTGGGTNTVTTLADVGPGSLRQILSDAGGGDLVLFATNGTIVLTNGELFLDKDLNLIGPGAMNLALSGNLSNRVLNISSNVTVSLSGLTICDGKGSDGISMSNAAPGVSGQDGAGIYNAGTLGLTDCVITNCVAGNGGTNNGSGGGGLGGSGGGIYNSGSLTMNGCTVAGNAGGTAGYGNPTGTGGHGGGLFSSGTLTGTNCVVADNMAGGPTLLSDSGLTARLGGAGSGGGIYNAGTLTLAGSTIRGNKSGDGGLTALLSVNGSCPGGSGGGLFNADAGTLVLAASAVSGNTCGAGGAGSPSTTSPGMGGPGGSGGGIHSAGSLTLSLCTVSGNSGGAGGMGGLGFGFFGPPPPSAAGGAGGNGGGIYSTGLLALTACTISANSAGTGGAGGYVIANGGLPGNGGGGGVGGGVFNAAASSSANLRNTLVAPNLIGQGGVGGTNNTPGGVAGQPGPNGSAPDLAGGLTSQGHNLIGSSHGGAGFTNGVAGDLAGTVAVPLDPQLLPLADNGGPTFTHAFSVTSPAFNAGDDSLTSSLPTDQRGAPRRFDAHVDIGAFELVFSTPSFNTLPAVVGGNSPVTGTANVTLHGAVNPGGLSTTVFFQFGTTTNYGGLTPMVQLGAAINPVPLSTTMNLASGVTYHCRVVATNDLGVFYGADQALTVPSMYRLGDLNGDGVVDQSELQAVLAGYWPANPRLQMTDPAGLGGTNVTFAFTNPTAGAFSVAFSTNLLDWQVLGPATPRYEFTDTNAPAVPQRFYRLRWP